MLGVATAAVELAAGSETSPVLAAMIDSARSIATELQNRVAAARKSFKLHIAGFLLDRTQFGYLRFQTLPEVNRRGRSDAETVRGSGLISGLRSH
jgi:hypothetical protein